MTTTSFGCGLPEPAATGADGGVPRRPPEGRREGGAQGEGPTAGESVAAAWEGQPARRCRSEEVASGQRLSPVLLVRGQAKKGLPLLVADGYHRICASYHLNENADIPCRLVDLA